MDCGALKVSMDAGGMSMDALMCEEWNPVLNPGGDGKPVEDGGDVLMFPHCHQDPSGRVLDVLKPLQTLSRDPNEKCITVVQSGGDKGMNQFFGIWEGKNGMEFGDVMEVAERGLA